MLGVVSSPCGGKVWAEAIGAPSNTAHRVSTADISDRERTLLKHAKRAKPEP